jgi:hypothetical protein
MLYLPLRKIVLFAGARQYIIWIDIRHLAAEAQAPEAKNTATRWRY